MLGNILVLAILILLSGIFAAAEAALVSVNKSTVKLKAENKDKRGVLLQKVLENPSEFLITLKVLTSIVWLFIGAFAIEIFMDYAVTLRNAFGMYLSESTALLGYAIIIVLVLSYFTVIFGEILPSKLGSKKATLVAFKTIRPLYFVSRIVRPFIKLFIITSDGILKLFGLNTKGEGDEITEEEIKMMLDVGSESGSIEEHEQEMINNIFEFNKTTAEDVSIHRTDIVALPIEADVDELIALLLNEKYSRIPIFEENLDNILGILHVKDLMKYLINNKDFKDFDTRKLLRDAYFVPFSKTTDELFKEMQKMRVHMAVVVDEYGGTVGIVTMEDLVEEIMGSILDEYDDVEIPDIMKLDDSTFILNGSTDLDIVNDYFQEINLPIQDYDTLSGFLIGQLGHIPEDDEKPEIEYDGFVFKVNEAEDKRISSVMVCKL